MNILIINGSPKGKYSTTLQTSLYLEILHPEHSFEYMNVGAQIKTFEKDFSGATEALERADLIVFSYPVYTFLVPSQLHRFIELMKENNVNVKGKFTTQISTSKHFYDVTAHAFIQENCQDMEMKYIKGLSADMEDLTMEKGQKEAEAFFDYIVWCVENEVFEAFTESKKMEIAGAGHEVATIVDFDEKAIAEKPGDIVIVADIAEDDVKLKNMINHFRVVSTRKTRVVNIHEFEFKGGCISCFNCAADGTCIYNDGFSELLRDQIQTAEAIVIAFSIKDHSMGSRFKMYDDRQFCNGHRTVTMGMPFGYLVNGNLSCEPNLKLVLEARAEVGGNFLAGIATDESNSEREVDVLAKRLEYAIEHKYVQPSNFLGVGGMKIFRDLIWLMQGLMRADYKFYKSHGQFDFPQKKRGTMIAMYGAGFMMNNKKLKAKMGGKLNDGMLMSYTKVLEKAKQRMSK